MSIKRISKIQPDTFVFSNDNLLEAEKEINKYPKGKKASAILALLHMVQKQNDLAENKNCSWTEVECLGACVNAPMMQINQDYFEDLNESKTEEIIQKLLKDEFPKPGSSRGRKNNSPEKVKTTLLEVKNA